MKINIACFILYLRTLIIFGMSRFFERSRSSLIYNTWGCTGFDARPARTKGKPKMRKHLRWSREKQCRVAFSNTSRFFERSRSSLIYNTWGCTGFDAVFGRSWLRVRALFPFINEQNKLNDNKVVSLDAFRAQKLAA